MAVAVLFTASCAKEDISSSIAGGEANVTFTVDLPELGTRAYGDGLTATNLQYYVYEKLSDGSLKKLNELCQTDGQAISGSTTVSLALIKGMNYVITFWADNNAAPYTFDGQTVRIDYTNVNANDEKLDAFYGTKEFNPSEDTDTRVELRRPFAQLNAIATDFGLVKNSGIKVLTSSEVTVQGFNQFNVLTGDVAGDMQSITFKNAAVPTDEMTDARAHLAMNYILVDTKQLVNATFTFNGKYNATDDTEKELAVNIYSNVPLQRNYKTNIIGKLLTSSTDFNVEIMPDFGKSDQVVATDATAAQQALDNADKGTTIQLQPGVNYGTLYLRPVADSPATKVVDWQGNNYGWETYSCFENLTIVGAEGATIDAIKVEGGTYYHTEHSQSAIYPVMLSLVELKNVVLDGVTFTGKGGYDPQGYGNVINLSGNNIKVNGLTLKNCVLNNSQNNARLLYKTESTTPIHTYIYGGETFTFSPSMKDITITGCTFNGGYIGLELRETENVTITNNVFEVGDRNILLPVNSGCTYTGNVTITGNTSKNAKERFVRMSGAGNAVVVIKDNTILNYNGADADYIKVTDGTNVTIENNVMGRSVYGLTLIPNGANSKIFVNDKEGFLNLTRLFADWRELFTDGNGNEFNNYLNGAGLDYYYGGYWTVSLETDIDLNNEKIDPIIIQIPTQTGFSTFNGNNHTIKNAKIETDSTTDNSAGLFKSDNCSIKNLVLDNIHVKGSLVGNSTAAILASDCNWSIDAVTIKNSSVWGGKYTGAVVGYGYTKITNCNVDNCVVKGGYKLGGIIGYICTENVSTSVDNNTLTDCTVAGTDGYYAGGKSEYIAGKVVGNFNCNGTCQGNTITNMTTIATANIGRIEVSYTVQQ